MFLLCGLLGAWQMMHTTADARELPPIDQGREIISFSPLERAEWIAKEGAAEPVAEKGQLVFSALDRWDALHALRRMVWDRACTPDLSRCSAVVLEVEMEEPESISQISLYFKSGDGWYVGSQPVSLQEGRQSLVFPKEKFGTEGEPTSWSNISLIRLAAWRAHGGRNPQFSPVALRTVEGALVILQGTLSCSTAEERALAARQAFFYSRLLLSAGIPHAVIPEEAVLSGALSQASCAILPYNPNPPAKLLKPLKTFLEDGNKLGVCYSSSAPLAGAMGFRLGRYCTPVRPEAWRAIAVDDDASLWPGMKSTRIWQKQFNLIPADPVHPESRVLAFWHDLALQRQAEPSLLVSPFGFWMTHTLQNGDNAAKTDLLTGLVVWLDNRFADYARAHEVARAAEKQTARRMAATHQPRPHEFIGIWDHSGTGLRLGNWERTASVLHKSGINALFANFAWGGHAHFDSAFLPLSDAGRLYGDQVAAALQALTPRGIQLHFWTVLWKLDGTDATVMKQAEADGLLQQNAEGKTLPWLSPHHPVNRMRTLAFLEEVATRYPGLAGIHLDYVRLPNGQSCYAPVTRERFEDAFGTRVKNWPADVLPGGVLHKEFRYWRSADITAFVAAAGKRLKQVAPQIKFSCAVFGKTAPDGGAVGQYWPAWLEQGLVDFLTPMNYTASDREFRDWLKEQMRYPGAEGRIYPGIGVHADEANLDVPQVLWQVQEARAQGVGGYVFFSLTDPVADDLLPALSIGAEKLRRAHGE